MTKTVRLLRKGEVVAETHADDELGWLGWAPGGADVYQTSDDEGNVTGYIPVPKVVEIDEVQVQW